MKFLLCYFYNVQISLHHALVNPRIARSQSNLVLFILEIWILKQSILCLGEKKKKNHLTSQKHKDPFLPQSICIQCPSTGLVPDSLQINKEHLRKAVGANYTSYSLDSLLNSELVCFYFLRKNWLPLTTAMLWNKINKKSLFCLSAL